MELKIHSKLKIKNSKFARGFSLVELITVIAIVGIMIGVAVVSLMPARTLAKLDAAGREVAAAIKLAQSYALQGKAVKDNGSYFVPCGFGIYINNSTDYEIFYLKDTVNNDCATFNTTPDSVKNAADHTNLVEKHTLQNGITFRDSSSRRVVYFTVPHGVMLNKDGNAFADTDIDLKFSNNTKKVSIDKGGAVTEGAVQ